MTTKEKAAAYDAAIKKVKELAIDDYLDAIAVTDIFPELKESEDEKTIKEIKQFIHSRGMSLAQSKVDSWLAWLEKQGEQKPDDRVEPKFKIEEGKWYVCISQFCNCIEGRVYKATSDSRIMDNLGTEYDMHSDAYKYFRLWTIQDAKDGDVLVCEDFGYTSLMLFESFSNGRISLHCWYNSQTNNFHINTDVALRKDVNIYPATKEQRDLLFQKMKEAGYEWDAEKKELKKIEQKPIWSEEDEKMIESLTSSLYRISTNTRTDSTSPNYTFYNEINWLKSLKDRVQPQSKQEWSEEDDQYLLVCKNALAKYQTTDKWDASVIYRWLVKKVKSLRPQSTWKPCDYELEVLRFAAEKDGTCLMGLYEQLKKLKGE